MTNRTDINTLIDAIVKQTVVLIAQLATTGGQRAPLAHIANQVFMGLVEELQGQGVNQKVTADMFGMALRTYQRKCQRILESETEQGRSLWEALLRFIQDNGVVSRGEIMTRFQRDDEGTVRSILNDLVESGLVFKTGYSRASRYRAADKDEQLQAPDLLEAIVSLVWVAVYHNSPITHEALPGLLAVEPSLLDEALSVLLEDGRVLKVEAEGIVSYHCDSYLIPLDDEVGWTAAVFDHFQAMVTALCTKLRLCSSSTVVPDDTEVTIRTETVGGSTFTFDLWLGHPLEQKVLGQLEELRAQVSQLRSEVEAYNAKSSSEGPHERVVVYLGQNVIVEEMGDKS